MSDPKTNTDTVRAYYELAFNEGKPEEAVANYLGDRYVQHTPQAATAPKRSSASSIGTAMSTHSCTSRSCEPSPRATSSSPTG